MHRDSAITGTMRANVLYLIREIIKHYFVETEYAKKGIAKDVPLTEEDTTDIVQDYKIMGSRSKSEYGKLRNELMTLEYSWSLQQERAFVRTRA